MRFVFLDSRFRSTLPSHARSPLAQLPFASLTVVNSRDDFRRHMGRGPFDLLASEAMALAKIDWNNDALYDPLPVTIMYSQRLSRTISNVSSLPAHSYPYRLFM